MGILYSFFLEITVEPPLTATYLSATKATLFCPGGQSIDLLLFKPLYNGNGHERMSPTAEINSRHRPEFFGDWWKSQEWSRIDPYGSFMINSGNPILIFFFIYTLPVFPQFLWNLRFILWAPIRIFLRCYYR